MDKAFLHQKYVVEKLNMKQISKLCFSSRPTISNYLREFNIPIRTPFDRSKLNKGQLGFGERRLKGAIVRHESEYALIGKAIELRKAGYSYRQISAWFDAMGIKTKRGGNCWSATSIMKILKSAHSCSQVLKVDQRRQAHIKRNYQDHEARQKEMATRARDTV
jgi:hypothetical protein